MRRRAPRPIGSAVRSLADGLAPATTLAQAQRCWPSIAGETIAAVARPTAERGGVLTVACSSSTWANELTLLAPELVQRLNSELGRDALDRAALRDAGCRLVNAFALHIFSADLQAFCDGLRRSPEVPLCYSSVYLR